jgi:hypothetical protein
MNEMVTYKTEVLEFNGERYTVQFRVRMDGEFYDLLATNELTKKESIGTYSKEVADDFKNITGESLENEVFQILKDELGN